MSGGTIPYAARSAVLSSDFGFLELSLRLQLFYTEGLEIFVFKWWSLAYILTTNLTSLLSNKSIPRHRIKSVRLPYFGYSRFPPS